MIPSRRLNDITRHSCVEFNFVWVGENLTKGVSYTLDFLKKINKYLRILFYMSVDENLL